MMGIILTFEWGRPSFLRISGKLLDGRVTYLIEIFNFQLTSWNVITFLLCDSSEVYTSKIVTLTAVDLRVINI